MCIGRGFNYQTLELYDYCPSDFEMRNTVIVSRGKEGVRGGLDEGAKY